MWHGEYAYKMHACSQLFEKVEKVATYPIREWTYESLALVGRTARKLATTDTVSGGGRGDDGEEEGGGDEFHVEGFVELSWVEFGSEERIVSNPNARLTRQTVRCMVFLAESAWRISASTYVPDIRGGR